MDAAGLAAALIAAHGGGPRVAADLPPLSRAEIMAVQSAVAAALGPVAGFKIGRGADGLASLAPIPARYTLADGGTRPVQGRLGIELELGFEVLALPPPGGLPDRPAQFFRPCVALELVDTRLAGAGAERADLKFADLQINAGVVVGARLAGWDGRDFTRLEARLTAAGQTVIDGPATVPGGSALASLGLLLDSLGDHCGGLRPGQVVITGSLCGLPWFPPGTAIAGHLGGIGGVAVHLGA